MSYIDRNVKLTALRQDILTILQEKHEPMGAYDVLRELKSKRPTAEPPTVYRVLDYLIEVHLVHRIESTNTYVCCTHAEKNSATHQAILFSCKNCQRSFEYEDQNIFLALEKFSQKNKILIDNTIIEMKGLCTACLDAAKK